MSAIDKIIGTIDLTNQISSQDYIWLVRLGIARVRDYNLAEIEADPGELSVDDIALLRRYATATAEQRTRIREHLNAEASGEEWREFFEPPAAKYQYPAE